MVDIIVPRRKSDFFEVNGEPTLRFVRWMESVTETSNNTGTTITEIEATAFPNAILLQQLRREIEGLPEFTIDTSGFTTDLTTITTDKVIA